MNPKPRFGVPGVGLSHRDLGFRAFRCGINMKAEGYGFGFRV